MLEIEPEKEVKKITEFIRKTLREHGFGKVVIGVSGGLDSTTSLYVLREAMPAGNIIAVYLPYFQEPAPEVGHTVTQVSINDIVDATARTMHVNKDDQVRMGNIMARVRMIVLYDLAKKHKALVAGTENRSEYHLSYFTRFGDEASDFEPIRHLFKTQVYQLAKYLGVPKKIIEQVPTAGLWQGQTDEGEFGFSYEEADRVLYLYFDKKQTADEIEKQGYKGAKKILEWVKKNDYKHQVPYTITQK